MKNNGLSKRLKDLRLQKKLSQSELGEMAGVHYMHIGKYERGVSLPNSNTLKKLAEALGVTTDFLLEGEPKGLATAKLDDRELLQMFKEIQDLQAEDKNVLKKLIEAFLTKKKIHELTKS